ncbi:hypothetical protein [Halalkalibacter alkalisediminis]|uniref:Uncharacterized protein n=1 Tax=Halalkalibacter alkalisediminis TaxID=935616 RepID=A0ABV6NK74_9BACI|nr:hypothetical protein [Halalkalibacter alkalisediminis]
MPNIQSSEQPLIGRIAIHQVDGRIVDSKLSSVIILEITTRSLSFVSQLKFPLSESIIYQLRTTIAENDLDLYGTIIKSMSKKGKNSHHYQFAFFMSHSQFIPLIQDAEVPRLYKQKGKYVTNEEL